MDGNRLGKCRVSEARPSVKVAARSGVRCTGPSKHDPRERYLAVYRTSARLDILTSVCHSSPHTPCAGRPLEPVSSSSANTLYAVMPSGVRSRTTLAPFSVRRRAEDYSLRG